MSHACCIESSQFLFLRRLAAGFVLCLGASASARAQVLIDFELAGPCSFNLTVPLLEQYAGLGVHFSGPSPLDGGAVLDQCGNFGMNAHSGLDFLAFNDGAGPMQNGGNPRAPEGIAFDSRVVSASIWAACGSPATFLLEAYDGAVLVASHSAPGVSAWTQLTVSVPAGMTNLKLSCSQAIFVLDDLSFQPELVTTYCTGKVNSLGCMPAMSHLGTPSATASSGFTVRATNVRNQKQGLLFYGVNGPAALPFQGGTLCVASQIKRTGAVNSGGSPVSTADCTGIYAIDMNTFAAGLLGGNPLPALQQVGTLVYCQFWGRDPGFPPPNNTALSNALQYTVGT